MIIFQGFPGVGRIFPGFSRAFQGGFEIPGFSRVFQDRANPGFLTLKFRSLLSRQIASRFYALVKFMVTLWAHFLVHVNETAHHNQQILLDMQLSFFP